MLLDKGPGRDRDKLGRMLRNFFIKKYGLSSTGKEPLLHLDVVTLSDYINQSLSDSEMENVKIHLSRCRKCRIEAESALDAVRRFKLGELEKAPDSASFDIDSYLKKLHNKGPGNPPKNNKNSL